MKSLREIVDGGSVDMKLKAPTIYLAGTRKKDWRSKVCNSFQMEEPAKGYHDLIWESEMSVLDRFKGVGVKPFHPDFQELVHNSESDPDHHETYGLSKSIQSAVSSADIIFVYLSSPPDPLTFLELGTIFYKPNPVIEGFGGGSPPPRVMVYMDELALNKVPKDPIYDYLAGYASPYCSPVKVEVALKNFMYKWNYDLLLHPESPIEQIFWENWLEEMWQDEVPHTHLEPNYSVYNSLVWKSFYIDFAHPETKVAVELDGMGHFGDNVLPDPSETIHRKYLDEDKVQKHYQRHRLLQEEGWELIRFTGKEVKDNPLACCQYVEKAIRLKRSVGVPALDIDPELLRKGIELKRLRIDAGLTQQEAAKLTGLQRRRFSDFERGLLYLPSDSEALLRKKYHEIIKPKLDKILRDIPLTYSDEDRLETGNLGETSV